VDVNLKSLIAKLNDTSRRALESAAGLCLSRSNYNVEIEHWLLKILELTDSDLARLLRYYEIEQARLTRELTRSIDRLKTGNTRPPALSVKIVDLVREAWVLASIEFGAPAVRTGHLLLAMLADDDLLRLTRETMPELARISADALRREMRDIVSGSAEDEPAGRESSGEAPAGGPALGGKTPALDQFTVDLTLRARQGKIDPVLGRDFEVRQVVDILTRRRQNNPILTGEAGVGKTAVVEGFALRIAAGDVPPPLKNVALRTLDLGLLQAGAGVKGEFENRLKSVIDEVKRSPQPIILFIDEAHTMIGAGGQAGQGDAANLLKPALARGELRTIAATTWSEYKKYFEKDAALARRFQVVKVEEPTEAQAVIMMRGLAATLEKHHNLRILDEAIQDAVRLSHRYITGRQLPDKAVSLLDTACARVAIGHSAIPPALEDLRRTIDNLDVQIGILKREAATGGAHDERLAGLATEKSNAEVRLAELEKRWNQEKELVTRIREIRARLEEHAYPAAKPAADADAKTPPTPPPTEADVRKFRDELRTAESELRTLQGEKPLMQVCVEPQTIAEVVSGWTGIPVGKMLTDEIKTVMTLKERLEDRIIGQSHALELISQRIRTARANLTDPRRPIGVFMMVGPSGVGKTETAMALADILYGGERNMVIINMSEYQEAHTVSALKGSPPGYVGYGEGGVLTEAVRRKPYSVVLLDEIEKAHTDVMELFYQVFDKGVLEDSEGREIDFKNTVILLTSNVGTDTVMKLCADPETRPDPVALAEALRPDLLKVFQPAFLGRMTVVPYYPLADDVMRQIIRLQLGRIASRLRANHRAEFVYDDALVNAVASRCREVESGARNIDHILTRTLLPELSSEFLARMATGEPIARVHVSVGDDGAFCYQIS
jgi:type VI secretion system protein VasG